MLSIRTSSVCSYLRVEPFCVNYFKNIFVVVTLLQISFSVHYFYTISVSYNVDHAISFLFSSSFKYLHPHLPYLAFLLPWHMLVLCPLPHSHLLPDCDLLNRDARKTFGTPKDWLIFCQFIFRNVCFEDKMTWYWPVWLFASFCVPRFSFFLCLLSYKIHIQNYFLYTFVLVIVF